MGTPITTNPNIDCVIITTLEDAPALRELADYIDEHYGPDDVLLSLTLNAGVLSALIERWPGGAQ